MQKHCWHTRNKWANFFHNLPFGVRQTLFRLDGAEDRVPRALRRRRRTEFSRRSQPRRPSFAGTGSWGSGPRGPSAGGGRVDWGQGPSPGPRAGPNRLVRPRGPGTGVPGPNSRFPRMKVKTVFLHKTSENRSYRALVWSEKVPTGSPRRWAGSRCPGHKCRFLPKYWVPANEGLGWRWAHGSEPITPDLVCK